MKILLLLLALAAGTASPGPAAADDELDTDTVREWVREGKVLPLEKMLERHRDRIPGRLLDLEVEREHDRIIYELEVVDKQGVVHKIYLDARNGEWLGGELKD